MTTQDAQNGDHNNKTSLLNIFIKFGCLHRPNHELLDAQSSNIIVLLNTRRALEI